MDREVVGGEARTAAAPLSRNIQLGHRTGGAFQRARATVSLSILSGLLAGACQHGANPNGFEPCGNAARVVECAQFTVPERPDGAYARELSLRIVRIRQDPAERATVATFVLAGGPGSAAPEMARGDISVYDAWAQHGDVVFLDQRGTEDGSPLRCPVSADFDPFTGIFPMEDLSSCRDEAARATDLAAYSTQNAAEDIEAVRAALGYRQINFVALSYGTRLAMAYMERFPNHVRAAVLDGVVPRELRAPLHYVANAEEALRRLSELCQVDADCRSHGDPAVRFRSIMSALAATPTIMSVQTQPSSPERRVRVGPEDFAYAVRGLLYGDRAVELPRLLAHADSTGDLASFAKLYAQRAYGVARHSSLGLHLSVLCAEDVATLTPERIDEVSATTVAGSYLVDQYVAACGRWRVTPEPPDTATSRLTAPLLLLSGSLDPVTPPQWGDTVRARSTTARHVIFPYGGHTFPGAGMEDCKAQIVREFLETARPEALDTTCTEGAPPPDFPPPA